jgi:DNA gyrase subunit B
MKELVELGHVYAAVPPLYRVKIGSQERFIEKESHLEELLIRERAKDAEVTDRTGESFRITETRHQRFVKALTEFEGWMARLRADHGSLSAAFVVDHRLAEHDVPTLEAAEKLLPELGDDDYELASSGIHDTLTLSGAPDRALRVKLIERETNAATHTEIAASMLASPTYAGMRKTYARLLEIAGPPPFSVTLGKKSREAATFDALRTSVLDLAKEGIQLSRFKGLGEMNADELWETTMNPDNRVLVQVGVEDAALADHVFSMLMGDEVEPRRVFIEQNAKYARLDV